MAKKPTYNKRHPNAERLGENVYYDYYRKKTVVNENELPSNDYGDNYRTGAEYTVLYPHDQLQKIMYSVMSLISKAALATGYTRGYFLVPFIPSETDLLGAWYETQNLNHKVEVSSEKRLVDTRDSLWKPNEITTSVRISNFNSVELAKKGYVPLHQPLPKSIEITQIVNEEFDELTLSNLIVKSGVPGMSDLDSNYSIHLSGDQVSFETGRYWSSFGHVEASDVEERVRLSMGHKYDPNVGDSIMPTIQEKFFRNNIQFVDALTGLIWATLDDTEIKSDKPHE